MLTCGVLGAVAATAQEEAGDGQPWRDYHAAMEGKTVAFVPMSLSFDMAQAYDGAMKARADIIFDEPTATLTPEEKDHFFALIERLRDRGVTIVFISHALEEALNIADRITILRDGELVITDDVSRFDRETIVRHMVGRELSHELYDHKNTREARPRGPAVLSVENLSMGKVVRNTSFTVYGGQITGMFGLIGSGRTETAKIVSGVL